MIQKNFIISSLPEHFASVLKLTGSPLKLFINHRVTVKYFDKMIHLNVWQGLEFREAATGGVL